MQYYSVTPAGLTDELWPIANLMRELVARLMHWEQASGTVEGYELINVRNSGHVAVLYSYSVQDTFYSGQFRKAIGLVTTRHEEKVEPVIERFPRGKQIGVLYCPSRPNINVALLAGTDALWTA
jgi:hypothetical protein